MDYWVLQNKGFNSQIIIKDDRVCLINNLVYREIEFEGGKTVSYKNLQRDIEFIDSACSDFAVSINGKKYSSNNGFSFVRISQVDCMQRVPFARTQTMTEKGEYPPKGKAILLEYNHNLLGIEVAVRYEIYDGMPTIMKMVNVKNVSEKEIVVDNIFTETLNITENRDALFIDSDYDSTTDFLGLDFSRYAKHYAHYIYGTLEVAPEFRMNVKLSQNEKLDSIIAYELAFMAQYYEQKLIEVKAMYRKIAPWCTDNVLFFHLISNSSSRIRKAIDQCADIGIEMIIQSFGSGVNMESSNEFYLNRIKKAYDYAHEKGLRIGAYTLAYVKNYRPVRSHEALNHDYSHICRCLDTEWSHKYMKNILRFLDRTGADAIEIDGPYGMLMCSGGKTHNHEDFTDSQYKQWKASVVEWYKEIKARGVYINAPDWHFLNGTNRMGCGYEEIAFSEARQEQLITSRIYYYKGTFSKNSSQGWGFLPLDVYHGGGDKAKFYPTDKNAFDFDWALAQVTASGIWPTIRGKKVYDCEVGKEILKKWVAVFKKYREVLNGYTIHFMPPIIDKNNPTRTTCIDAIMNQLPYGDNRGFVMFFNQTDKEITQEITLPVFYTGLTELNMPPAPFPNTKNDDIYYPVYGEEIEPLVIKARDGKERKYITDSKVIDLEIPKLPKAENTNSLIVISQKDENPQTYNIDTNGNVKMTITLKPMSYDWYVMHPLKEK